MSKVNIKNSNCVHCGACTAVCTTNALFIDTKVWELHYESSQCSGCNACISACPLRIIQSVN